MSLAIRCACVSVPSRFKLFPSKFLFINNHHLSRARKNFHFHGARALYYAPYSYHSCVFGERSWMCIACAFLLWVCECECVHATPDTVPISLLIINGFMPICFQLHCCRLGNTNSTVFINSTHVLFINIHIKSQFCVTQILQYKPNRNPVSDS